MAFANSDLTQVAIIKEVTWGTIPATPVWEVMNYVSETLNADVTHERSKRIRGDNNRGPSSIVGVSAAGGISFELDAGNLDTILELFIRDAMVN